MHTAGSPFLGPGTIGWLIAGAATAVILGYFIRRWLKYQSKRCKDVGDTEQSKIGGLSKEQALVPEEIRKICREFAISRKRLHEDALRGELQHWFCPICLHGHKGGGTLLELPCGHRMHAKCAENAYDMNLTNCAVCGWDVRTLFNKAPLIKGQLIRPTMNRGLQTPRFKATRIDVYDEDSSDDSSSVDSRENGNHV